MTSGVLVVRVVRTCHSDRAESKILKTSPNLGNRSHQQVVHPPHKSRSLVRSMVPSLEGQFEVGLHRVAKRWLSSAQLRSLSFLPFGEVSSGENVSVGRWIQE